MDSLLCLQGHSENVEGTTKWTAQAKAEYQKQMSVKQCFVGTANKSSAETIWFKALWMGKINEYTAEWKAETNKGNLRNPWKKGAWKEDSQNWSEII